MITVDMAMPIDVEAAERWLQWQGITNSFAGFRVDAAILNGTVCSATGSDEVDTVWRFQDCDEDVARLFALVWGDNDLGLAPIINWQT